MKTHFVEIGKKNWTGSLNRMYWAAKSRQRARDQGLPGVRGGREQGSDSKIK